VSYGYTTFTDAYGAPWGVYALNRWVTSRTSGGGIWHYTPEVTGAACTACNQTPAQITQQVTVTKPSGDYSIYKFRASGNLAFVAKEINSYGSGSVLLKQELIDYHPCLDAFSAACPVQTLAIPLRSTTTMFNSSGGSLTTKTEYEYGN